MRFLLELNNKTKYKFSKKTFKDVFEKTIIESQIPCLEGKNFELSLALVGLEEIHGLNLQYRNKDKATDVLSFGDFEKKDDLCRASVKAGNDPIFLGELIVCPSYVEKNSKEDGEELGYAMKYIVSHGILHLLGFPHGKKMFTLQKSVADSLK